MYSSLISTNEVVTINDTTSEVKVIPNIELTLIGKIMSPLIKLKLGKTLDDILQDLKYFVEKGKLSPKKLASQK